MSFISFHTSNAALIQQSKTRDVIPGELCHDFLTVAPFFGTALIKQRLVLLHKPLSSGLGVNHCRAQFEYSNVLHLC